MDEFARYSPIRATIASESPLEGLMLTKDQNKLYSQPATMSGTINVDFDDRLALFVIDDCFTHALHAAH